ncbi:MAG: glycoside hydrolase family 15 protein, partial [Flavisolibacter sp.]
DLVLFAGTIDDADETYFNGHLVGSSGKFPPGDQSAWDIQRKYLIKKDWVQKKNTIAIRVYNGIGDGGIISGELMILTKKENDRRIAVQLKSKKSYYQLTTSNGLISAVYNSQTNVIENVYPHIFSYYDSGKVVKPFVQNLRITQNIKPLSCEYEKNTHVIKVTYPSFTVEYVAPFTTQEKILYAVVKGKADAIKAISFESERTETNLITNQEVGLNLGTSKYFLFSYSDSLENYQSQFNEAVKRTVSNKSDLVSGEVSFMQGVIGRCRTPKNLSLAERNMVEQGISILKMSQVGDKEIFRLSPGQVLASLRPGVWAISWVRDASFAIEAMSKLGMYAEAKKALEFMLNAKPTDQYIHYVYTDGKDYGIGVPYIVSVTRYFGNGREESDYNENGPNIEIDDFGLFLTAVYHYVHESGDKDFLLKWNTALSVVEQAIVHNINQKKIIRAESGPWEHHLPGKEFTWTSGVCARGLQLVSSLQQEFGLSYQPFQNGHKTLLEGIMNNCLIDNRYIKGNATEQSPSDHHYYDAATFELFANGLINDKKLFLSHMQEYDLHNRINKDPSKGYCRFNSNDSYENQEWPFAGLRVAVAQDHLGNKAEAKRLIDRITSFASRNNNQVPEILSNDLGLYRGAIPMVGYGSGAYIIAVLDYYSK